MASLGISCMRLCWRLTSLTCLHGSGGVWKPSRKFCSTVMRHLPCKSGDRRDPEDEAKDQVKHQVKHEAKHHQQVHPKHQAQGSHQGAEGCDAPAGWGQVGRTGRQAGGRAGGLGVSTPPRLVSTPPRLVSRLVSIPTPGLVVSKAQKTKGGLGDVTPWPNSAEA